MEVDHSPFNSHFSSSSSWHSQRGGRAHTALCTAKWLTEPSGQTSRKSQGWALQTSSRNVFFSDRPVSGPTNPWQTWSQFLTGFCWIICLGKMCRALLWEWLGGGSSTKAQMWWTAVGSSSLGAYNFVSNLSWIKTKSFVSKMQTTVSPHLRAHK